MGLIGTRAELIEKLIGLMHQKLHINQHRAVRHGLSIPVKPGMDLIPANHPVRWVCDPQVMLIRVDESGDFDFRDCNRFWVGAIASVIIPDRRRSTVEIFVAERKLQWGMEAELKARGMEQGQLMEMAAFIEKENLPIVGVVTDSEIFDIAAQRRWRTEQFTLFEKDAARSRRVAEDPDTRVRVERIRRRLSNERLIKPPNFLQYFVLMPWLLSHSFSAANFRFRDLPPAEDSWTFDIAVVPARAPTRVRPGNFCVTASTRSTRATTAPPFSSRPSGPMTIRSWFVTRTRRSASSRQDSFSPEGYRRPCHTPTPVSSSPTSPPTRSTLRSATGTREQWPFGESFGPSW
jgi:hypothetical protein